MAWKHLPLFAKRRAQRLVLLSSEPGEKSRDRDHRSTRTALAELPRSSTKKRLASFLEKAMDYDRGYLSMPRAG